ncbi:MAG: 4Fe-4S binding protein [Deltaproteobacteria bacterium]|nr:4Fe-4S binding protein [Deltaproteobacteria bacterium]MBW2415147.1 4Fe-4S binding protein [Deltaproteobacteria bacterium]
MSLRWSDLWRDVAQTALRLVPWPTEPGLRSVGDPGPESPVVVTGNYDLTVRRLVRALRGVDAWIVVAASGGINVWCAASGGHLTTHQVVAALKTCGVEERVRHRRAVLPQLAATGVIGRDVSRRCGWKVRFGPARADDLPEYFANRDQKTDAMRRVRFGVVERLEMACTWAAPTAFLLAAAAAPFRPGWSIPLAGGATALSVALFLGYDRIPAPRRTLFAAGAAILAAVCVTLAGGGAPALATGVAAGLVLAAVLTYDYSGTTPIEGGSHFEERRWRIVLDPERCDGVFSCWEVCPEACFEKRQDPRRVEIAYHERCVRCGACVVQCPKDALSFNDADGRRIEPDVIRRFKLNLLGKRVVASPQGKQGQEEAGTR